MKDLKDTKQITDIILKAKEKAQKESKDDSQKEYSTSSTEWPINCLVGPGLEGAIACQSKIGYVHGSKGWLIYRGYDIFDLCAHSNFEEVSYLLMHGNLPTPAQLELFKKKLVSYRDIQDTIRLLVNFPVETMNSMAGLRLGTALMRHKTDVFEWDERKPNSKTSISADEDSIAMETIPKGEEHAIYEFKAKSKKIDMPVGFNHCYQLISGVSTVCAAVARLRHGKLPLEPNPELSHAANLLYMMTGRIPTPVEEKIMDISLILHADHGMNASTFATMVVASTLSDVNFAIGAGIAALNGPLHGGANEQVLNMLKEINGPDNVDKWYKKARDKKKKIMGFGHRVYKAYDPRARVLSPLAELLIKSGNDKKAKELLKTAKVLEKKVVSTLGEKKKIFPNVDFYSGLMYSALGIPEDMFTPIFAVSRVSGWTARVMEYLENNRIFRPRAIYTGRFDRKYKSLNKRAKKNTKK